MKNIQAGRGATKVFMPTLDIFAHHRKFSVSDVWLYVTYFWEPYIAATDDEPECPEFIDVINVYTTGNITLHGSLNDTSMYIGKNVEISSLLNEWEMEDIVTEMRKQNNGYVDNDNLRAPVNQRVLRELGHGLTDYDWSDK